ncbi:MAG: hypothetical protein K8R74_10905, partial [Bacteroidales bacterium]|nr:hypothetical protein [Bacteroidales bacterium]
MKDSAIKLNNSIAIVGMACVFPGAHSPEELWQNVLAGRRYFRKTPDERLPLNDYYDPDPLIPGKTYCDQMAVITDWKFDPIKYRIPPITFNATDLTHWLALFTAKQALEKSGIDLKNIDRTRVGVILGNSLTGEFSRSHNLRFRWPYIERTLKLASQDNGYNNSQTNSLIKRMREIYEAPLPEITEDSLAGGMSNTIAGRVCNYFDLGAGGFTVDGACSSSLISVATACNALKNNEMDIVITGGVDISLDAFEIIGFAKTHALTKNDIKPYDRDAAGMIAGEGCGIVILTSEEYARKNGHEIDAFIKGWGYSSDGKGGITAPKVEGQMRALQQAYNVAGYPISSVDLIEGHGTGTTVGDKVEIETILNVINNSSCNSKINIGSIKANIGHCKAAAGTAGLIKIVMALKNKILPPTLNCNNPNPVFGKPLNKLQPLIEGKVWNSMNRPRRASVSAMGFGGSNSHVTLEEANPDVKPSKDDLSIIGSHQKTELLLFSAKDMNDLKKQIEKIVPISERICRAELTDLSAALAINDHKGIYRLAIVADSTWQLVDSLNLSLKWIEESRTIEEINDPGNGIFAGETKENPKIIALFPGQGSQRLNMGKHLLSRFSFVREWYKKSDKSAKDILPHGFINKIF